MTEAQGFFSQSVPAARVRELLKSVSRIAVQRWDSDPANFALITEAARRPYLPRTKRSV